MTGNHTSILDQKLAKFMKEDQKKRIIREKQRSRSLMRFGK
jgi:hypothetical protein